MKKLIKVENITASSLKAMSVKAFALAGAIDMEIASADTKEKLDLAVISASLRRYGGAFGRYALGLTVGKLPPKAARDHMNWVAAQLNERIKHGKPIENPSAEPYATRNRAQVARW
jgi:hypothetical protein